MFLSRPLASRPLAVLLGAVTAAAAIGPVLCGEPATGRLDPDAALQASLDATLSAIARQDPAAEERVVALQRLAAGRRETLLLQLALALEKSTGTEQSMAGAILLRRLAFSPGELVGTLVPRLDEARPSLRRVFTGLLASVDHREGGAVEFGVYESWLAGRAGPPPAALVRYLYESSPGDALRCMRNVYGAAAARGEKDGALGEMEELRERRDASHPWTAVERDRARAALATLAASPGWWDRRYAAAVLATDRTLGTPDLIHRLETDPDPLVRNALVPEQES